MEALEAGSRIAIATGVLHFALLIAAGLAVGWGLLALVGFPADPIRRLVLAPFTATMVWSLAGNLLVRSGFTMAQVAPVIGVVSLGLAAFGIASAARARLRPGVVGLVLGLGLVAGLVTWPYFARGLGAHLGSGNPDTAYYTSMATVFWRHGLDAPPASLPFFERFGAMAKSMGLARNHTFVLLALLSPLGQAGEPVFVRNLFVGWSIFVLACSLGFYALSWTGPTEGRSRFWWAPLFYVSVTLGVGWAVVPALVGNWDNGLFVTVGPVLAGLAAAPTPGLGPAVFLGTSLAYAVYTYPELAPLLGLFLLPFYLPTTRPRPAVHALAAATAVALLSPGVKALWAYFRTQMGAARVPEALRAGGGFAAGLVATPFDLSAWWALGTEHGRPARSGAALQGLFLCGLFLTALALAGMVRLARRGGWRELASLGLVGASLGYFLYVERYGYAGYKILSVAWWLVGRCLVEGCAGLVAVTGIRRPASRTGRVWHGLTVCAVVGILLAGLVVAAVHRFGSHFSGAEFRQQPTLTALGRLRSAAAGQPPIDVLVAPPLAHYLTLPWILYVLKDTPLRIYHEPQVGVGFPGEARWSPDRPVPRAVLLRSRDLHAAPVRFRTPEFALVDLDSTPVVERIDNPNQLESWGTWLGTSPITVSVLGRPGVRATLSFEATPGPSRPDTTRRTLVLHAGPRQHGRVEIDGPTTVAFPFVTAGGREVLALSTPDTPSVTVLPNGDARPLLVGIRGLRVHPAPGPPRP